MQHRHGPLQLGLNLGVARVREVDLAEVAFVGVRVGADGGRGKNERQGGRSRQEVKARMIFSMSNGAGAQAAQRVAPCRTILRAVVAAGKARSGPVSVLPARSPAGKAELQHLRLRQSRVQGGWPRPIGTSILAREETNTMGLLQALGLAAVPLPAGAGEAGAETSKQGEDGVAGSAKGGGPAKGGEGGGESPMDVKADVAAVLQQVLDLVLGGIPDDEARKAVNAEYLKLKAAFDKADKLGSAKAKVTAYQAILQPAQDLRAKAEGIRYTFGLWDGNGKQLVGPARTAIGKIEGTAKAVLETTLAGLEAEALRAARAGDSTALQSTVQPKLVRLHAIATQLPKRSKEIDDGIAAAAKVLLALDKKRASELLARLAKLQDAKKSGWPAGTTFEEVAASVDGLLAEARALQTEGKELTTNLADEKELDAVRKRLDGLKPRIDRANDTGMPKPVEDRQANVRNFAKVIEEQMAAKNKAAVLKTLGNLTLSLGDMEQMKDRHAAYRKKFEAARDGPVKKARALKLTPADFATSRATPSCRTARTRSRRPPPTACSTRRCA